MGKSRSTEERVLRYILNRNGGLQPSICRPQGRRYMLAYRQKGFIAGQEQGVAQPAREELDAWPSS